MSINLIRNELHLDKSVTFLSLNICYVLFVLLWIKYLHMRFESLLVFILFKFIKTSQHFQNLGFKSKKNITKLYKITKLKIKLKC